MEEKQTGHTPGPWRIHWMPWAGTAEIEAGAENDESYRHITNQMPMLAGSNNPDVEIVTHEEREYRYSAEACANARLIAAAPDLLVALSNIIKAADNVANRWEHGDLAQAVNELMIQKEHAAKLIEKATTV